MSTSPVTLIGNVTNDPEMRFTEGGNGKIAFGIAVERSWKAGDEWKKETSFFNVIGWDPLATEAARVISKGVRVMVSGRLQQRSYEKDGDKRSVVEIVADEISLSVRSIESFTRKVREQNGEGAPAPRQSAPRPTVTPPAEEPF